MYKIKLLFTQILLISSFYAYSQVGIGTNNPDNSAKLEVFATDKGILIPRLTVTQRTSITNPAEGLLVYQKDDVKGFYYYDGTQWNKVLDKQKDATPVGTVITLATDIVPNGYLECDGSAVSRITYADLFTKIGTRYGNGNGTTTFNLPDYRGAFLRGYNHGSNKDPDAITRNDSGDGTTGDNVGTKQSYQIKLHNHQTVIQSVSTNNAGNHRHNASSTTTSSAGGHNHFISLSGNTGYNNISHNHSFSLKLYGVTPNSSSLYKAYFYNLGSYNTISTSNSIPNHYHSFTVSGNTNTSSNHYHTIYAHNTNYSGNHQHSLTIPSLTTYSVGGSESRPKNISVMYCIKY